MKKKLAFIFIYLYSPRSLRERDLAQPGRALALGARCRRFESSSPDQINALFLQGFFYPIFKER